jgi:trimeric autotransporter adhesin
MAWRRIDHRLRPCVVVCLMAFAAKASQHEGQVLFNGLPVPGATVTATHGPDTVSSLTDDQGVYSFPDLADGIWKMEVRTFGFAPSHRDVAVEPNAEITKWELALLSLDQIKAEIQAPAAPSPAVPETAGPEGPQPRKPDVTTKPEDDLSQRAADGFLINGSMNNGASSPLSQAAAFGNNRNGGKGLYNGGIGVILGNSAFDARPFSLTGQNTPKASYNQTTGVATLGGPFQIPHLLKNGPNFFVGYQWTHNNNATTESALVPDLAQRNGIFSTPIIDPSTGMLFPGNVIPQNRISPQAQALLTLYPLPNVPHNAGYNYQIPILSPTHQDALQSRANKTFGSKDQVYGRFALQSTRMDNPNVFDFLDTADVLGIDASVNWVHRLNQQWFLNLGLEFSRLTTRVTPYFENRVNVSGQAGITGNNQDPTNWGPPTLAFSSGIAGLTDAQSAYDRNQTTAVSYSMQWNHRLHNVTFGGDFRRQQFNYLSQQNPRGTFTFTGGVTGSDFGDFMLGIPDTSTIAYGNADKYFRQWVYDAYINDDWRIAPGLSLDAGLRWEYGAPITEEYNRLVNLDITPGYAAVAPVVASNPVGPLTGTHYSNSLVQPDRRGIQPRVGIAWHPMAGSSMVVRAGYGVYYDSSVYQTIALQMGQQPPLSTAFSVQNSSANPLTLANGFNAPSMNTFAIDPNFRVGYAQNWQISIQRDLPASLQLTGTYLGIKGTRGVQEFLPNTYPAGAVNPCQTCPNGFAYLASNGNSTRQSAEVQLRRRLHSGLAATLQYTFSKSIDDDAALGGQGAANQDSFSPNIAMTGGATPLNLPVAQNWLNLSAERGLSTFDQRQLLKLQMQYTSGMGLQGGTLLSGRKGSLLKDWTIATQITAGTGLPQNPVHLVPVEGTGVTGSIRPDTTGAPIYAAPPGYYLNPAAYTAPQSGYWGNAGRNSITGPAQFTLNASLGRTFRVGDRLNLDFRVDSINALNHVNFTAWNTIVDSPQFGLPAAANAMRSIQLTLRLRF